MDITPLSDSLSGDKALYDKAFKLVPGYRQQKICNFKNDSAKCRCLAAGLLLNYTTRTFISGSVSGSITGSLADNTPTVKNIPFPVTVSAAVCTYAQEYDYETACIANGKPYFKEHENLHFNLSHSGNFAVCIVAGMPCGIDIEGNRPFKPSVAKRFFSKTEYHWIYDTENVSVQAERFFRLWTLKEAYAKATGNEVPEGAFSIGQRRAMIILAIVISCIAWIWAFILLSNSHSHPAYFVAGHVMVGLACICTSLIALVATIARQVRNDYSERERNKWPKLVLLMGSISFVWGIFVILADSGSANGTTGYIMLGLGLVCYSISSKVILLAKIWRREFKLANRIPMIPVLTALACLFLAAFVFELATVNADYFIPARVLVGLGAICFTLFSIVSILESGTSSK